MTLSIGVPANLATLRTLADLVVTTADGLAESLPGAEGLVPYAAPYRVLPAEPVVEPGAGAEPDPLPLPLPAAGEASTAKVTVVTNEGAKVTFDGIESDNAGTRHSFTTRPIPAGAELRVRVSVDGSTVRVGVKAGERATVDMRK